MLQVERYDSRIEIVRHPVCRFLIQGLCSKKGRAKNDFHIDLVLSVDGLLTLVKSVYGILKKNQELDESYRTLHWRLHFHGDVFTLADPEIHHFLLLHFPICNGESGRFEGSNASFRFTVMDVHAVEICPSQIENYPRIEMIKTFKEAPSPTMVCAAFTGLMKDDWLCHERKAQARDFCIKFREFMGGANVWSQDASGEYYRDRPKPPKWSSKEEQVLRYLILSGYKFQESWQNIMQYAFVNRSEAGTAQQWYKVRSREGNASRPALEARDRASEGECIKKAKSLCSEILASHLKAGIPKLGQHPQKRTSGDVAVDGGGSEESLVDVRSSVSLPKRRKVEFSPTTLKLPEI